jgi:hypothetical protein
MRQQLYPLIDLLRERVDEPPPWWDHPADAMPEA